MSTASLPAELQQAAQDARAALCPAWPVPHELEQVVERVGVGHCENELAEMNDFEFRLSQSPIIIQ